jgi:hypothetical protein
MYGRLHFKVGLELKWNVKTFPKSPLQDGCTFAIRNMHLQILDFQAD